MKTLYDPDAEKAVVASALLSPDVLGELDLTPDDFHSHFLATAYASARRHFLEGRIPDITLVSADLENAKFPKPVSELAGLVALDVNVANVQAYAERVKDLAERRRAKELIERAASALFEEDWRDHVSAVGVDLAQFDETGKAETVLARPKTSWTVTELYETNFPDPKWIVPNLIPVGLAFLAGRPKVGKSWLALQIAHAVSTGGVVLDQPVERGTVLYLAFEDSPRRLRNRLSKQAIPKDADIHFHTAWPNLADDGLNQLATVIPSYRLVIIDTISRAIGSVDQNDIGQMTTLLGRLQQLALSSDVSVIAIDHHRKPSGMSADPVDDILGSTAKSAVADVALGLTRQRGKSTATLHITGRDIEERELAISWDPTICAWNLEGTAAEVALRGNKAKTLNALRNAYPEGMSLAELAQATEIAKPNLMPVLGDLIATGYARKVQRTAREVLYYAISPDVRND